MKKQFDKNKWKKSRVSDKKFRIVFVTGGSKQCLVRKLARTPNTKVIAIDCEEELNRLKKLHDRLGVIQLSVGTRESLATLSESADPEVQAAVAMVASMLSREGCGASPVAARLAAEKLVASEQFGRCMAEVLAFGLKCTGGRIDLIELLMLCSYVGGMGAGATATIMLAVMTILAPLDVPVRVIIDALGPMTYAGVSENAGQNAAPTLGHFIFLATDKSNSAFRRMSIRINLAELPPLGQDAETRNSLVQLDEEAIRSQEIQEHLTRESPNRATKGRLGNILTREAEFFEPLEGAEEIAQSVAATLSHELKRKLTSLATEPSEVGEVIWVATSRPVERLQTDALISRMNEFTVEEFVRAAKQTGGDVEFDLELSGDSVGHIKLLALSEHLDELPSTFTEVCRRYAMLAEIERLLNIERWGILDGRDRLETEVQSHESRIRSLLHILQEPHWYNREKAIVSELATRVSEIRQAHDELVELDVKLAAVIAAADNATREKEYVEGRISDVQSLLSTYLPTGKGSSRSPLVTCKALDESFSELLSVVTQPTLEQVEAICRCVVSVTLEGLSRIVGAEHAKVAHIAEQIVFSDSVLACPPHGGIARSDSVLKVYALPPVNEPFRERLRSAIASRDKDSVVVFNDSADFAFVGLTVIRYEFRGFYCIDELLVGTVKQDHIKAEQSDTKQMRYPTGHNPWPYLSRFLKPGDPPPSPPGFDPSSN